MQARSQARARTVPDTRRPLVEIDPVESAEALRCGGGWKVGVHSLLPLVRVYAGHGQLASLGSRHYYLGDLRPTAYVALAPLGYATTFQNLFAEAAAGKPDPKRDFEPHTVSIREETTVSVVDQGGEPHTFTEVKQFGGGFIPGLNNGEARVPECAAGFSDVANPNPSGQHLTGHRLAKRYALFSVLHSPVDAREGRGEVSSPDTASIHIDL